MTLNYGGIQVTQSDLRYMTGNDLKRAIDWLGDQKQRELDQIEEAKSKNKRGGRRY